MICESFGRLIKIRGRRQDKSRYTNTVSFKPYFYVHAQKDFTGETFTTLNGAKVRKVEFTNTNELIQNRHKYSVMYENDVRHIIKYKIDKHDILKEEPIRSCFLDIETEDRHGFPSVKNADKMISSICCYDSFTQKYYVFLTSPSKVQNVYKKEYEFNDKIEVKIFERESETDMLLKFIDFVKNMDFDLFYAWNGDWFDYPYILNRMKNLNIDSKLLSPFNKFTKDNDIEKPSGRAFIDLLVAYKKLSTQQIESYSLDYVSEVELGTKKVQHSEKIGDMWENNINKFLEYNIKDVYLMVKIEAKKGITNYFDNIRRISYCTWYDVFYNARVLDCYMLKCAHDWNIILPSRDFNSKNDEPVQGAIVGVNKIGLSHNVAVADVKSLYPSAIKTCNMSPETIIKSETKWVYKENKMQVENIECCHVNDVMFRLDKRGFIPRVIDKLWDMRAYYKTEMHKHKYNSDEYNILDTTQTVCKFLINSIYGVMKFESFRLYNRDVFRSVTHFGRKNNEFMQQIVEETGHELVLYDTDSNDFILNETKYDDMIKEAKYVIGLMNSRCEQWIIDNFKSAKYNCIEVEFETIYGTLLTIKNEKDKEVKKRYAGLIIYDDGEDLRDNPKMKLMGFAGKRSDTPPMFKNLQKEIIEMILRNNTDGAVKKLGQIRKDIIDNNYSPEDLALPIGVSKPLYEYERPSAAIRGAMFANQYCNENIGQGKIKYLYVVNKKYKPDVPRTDVVSFMEKFPTWMEINVSKMAERLIDKPYLNILYTLGYNINVLQGQSLLSDW